MQVVVPLQAAEFEGVGLTGGMDTSVEHFIPRYICYWRSSMPWNYIPFLDYAAERILLCKGDSSYVFIHRYLLEYFASLKAEIVRE